MDKAFERRMALSGQVPPEQRDLGISAVVTADDEHVLCPVQTRLTEHERVRGLAGQKCNAMFATLLCVVARWLPFDRDNGQRPVCARNPQTTTSKATNDDMSAE